MTSNEKDQLQADKELQAALDARAKSKDVSTAKTDEEGFSQFVKHIEGRTCCG
jgi:hypothetical protein